MTKTPARFLRCHNHMRHHALAVPFRLALLAGLTGGVGCAAGSDGPTPSAVPARLLLSTAPAETVGSGVAMSPAPVIQVATLGGEPVSARGILVTASLASGVGTLEGSTEVRTDQDGRAVFASLMGRGAVGPRAIRFSAPGLASVVSPTVQLVAGSPTRAVIAAGNNQTAAAGTALPVAPQVRVVDADNNPVPQVVVSFAVVLGGGTITATSVPTDTGGIASPGAWTLGTTIGPNTLTASVAGLADPLHFSATGIVGPVALLTIVEGDSQRVSLGGAVGTSPAVRVSDAGGNPIAGVSVSFAVASGGGTITGGTATSNSSGIARVGSWRLGLQVGAQTLTASRTGTNQVTFTAEAVSFDAVAISAGGRHSCALAADGVRCWGDNSFFQYGNGTDITDSLPVRGAGTLALAGISAGTFHTCGLTAAGAAWCWGNNAFGQLGDSSTVARGSPVAVAGGHTFRAISAGDRHTCALTTTGVAHCWGQGANGRLGNGLTTSSSVPVPVSGGQTWASIQAGGTHTCGRQGDGTLHCWGSNANGRLGDLTTTDRTTPVPVSGGGTWDEFAVGGQHACALRPTGEAFCWGLGSSGQLGGGGTPTQVSVPTAVSGTTRFVRIVAALASTCALTAEGVAWCWGNNGNGRLGDGTPFSRSLPTLVAGGVRFAGIALGEEHGCGRLQAGAVLCWGRNAEGQLGDGTRTLRLTPVGVQRP